MCDDLSRFKVTVAELGIVVRIGASKVFGKFVIFSCALNGLRETSKRF